MFFFFRPGFAESLQHFVKGNIEILETFPELVIGGETGNVQDRERSTLAGESGEAGEEGEEEAQSDPAAAAIPNTIAAIRPNEKAAARRFNRAIRSIVASVIGRYAPARTPPSPVA